MSDDKDEPMQVVIDPRVWEDAEKMGPEAVAALKDAEKLFRQACDYANGFPAGPARMAAFNQRMTELNGGDGPREFDPEDAPPEVLERINSKTPERH